jgi:hypothetical protein
MTMRQRTIPIAIAATVALLALPGSAMAEYLVPEGNSAVTQYTEGFPTGGGEKKTEGSGNKGATPAKTIGAANAKKLEDHGPEGAAVAEVAAETAPEAGAATPESSNHQQNSQPKHQQKQAKDGKQGKGSKDKPADSGGKQEEGQTATPVTSQSGDGPSGSSGIGETLAAATGSSSGGLGLLLPLVILAAIAWGIAFFVRQRKRPDSAAPVQP